MRYFKRSSDRQTADITSLEVITNGSVKQMFHMKPAGGGIAAFPAAVSLDKVKLKKLPVSLQSTI